MPWRSYLEATQIHPSSLLPSSMEVHHLYKGFSWWLMPTLHVERVRPISFPFPAYMPFSWYLLLPLKVTWRWSMNMLKSKLGLVGFVQQVCFFCPFGGCLCICPKSSVWSPLGSDLRLWHLPSLRHPLAVNLHRRLSSKIRQPCNARMHSSRPSCFKLSSLWPTFTNSMEY